MSVRAVSVVSALSLVALVAACSATTPAVVPTNDAGQSEPGAKVRGDTDPVAFGGARPVSLYVPSAYSDDKPAPLLVLLHGYSASGTLQELYLGIRQHAETRGFLYAHPDGTVDASGKRFWNATECCDFGKTGVDDLAYLDGLVDEIGKRYKVDPKRVFLVGHSNGGFMSYRLACDKSSKFAGLVSIAGTIWTDAARCSPQEPVSILHVHGTADDTVAYDGGSIQGVKLPGAKETITRWAGYDGCDTSAVEKGEPLDIETSRPGAETEVTAYRKGCKGGSAVELWTMSGAEHLPAFSNTFMPKALDFLFAHPKP